MKLMTPGKDGKLVLDFDDVVQRLDRRGALCRRPGRADLAAAPGAGLGRTAAPAVPAAVPVSPVKQPITAGRRFAVVGRGAGLFFLLAALSPPALLGHLTVFALAIVIGYYVIGHAPRCTPR